MAINKQSFFWANMPIWFWVGVPVGVLITTTIALNGISSPSSIVAVLGATTIGLNAYTTWVYFSTLFDRLSQIIVKLRKNG